MQNIQAINVPIQVSDDGGNTWLTIVCISDHTLPVSSAVNKVNTQCGVAVGLGPVEFNPTGNGVTTMDETPGQATTKQLVSWVVAQKLIKYRLQYPGTGGSIGSLLYFEGNGIMTQCTVTETVGDVEKFSFTISGFGTVSTTPGVVV